MAEQAGDPYDVFISYADADRAWVEGYLLDALTQAGVRCYTEAAFALGAPRIEEIERAVLHSRRTLLVLSPAYQADHLNRFADLLAQSFGADTATWPVIPLILQPVALPARLGMLVSLDASDPASWPQIVVRLLGDLQRPAPGVPPPPPCPYPGMAPFTEADSDRFYGRETEVQELVARLCLHPLLAVIGRSGSGKSSLVFAGLIPALRASRRFGPGEWIVRAMRPGATPMAALQAAIGDVADLTTLRRTDAQADHLLLIVDQFEEVFTQRSPEADLFQTMLARLVDAPGCCLVLTVRADFFADLLICPLWNRIKDHRFELLPLDAAGLRQAIVRPAEDVRVYVEAALVERLIADAAGEPGVLPFVQETLALLWERLERRLLPLRAYEALVLPSKAYEGAPRTGLQVAMARHADAALAALPDAQQAIARRIFLRLVQFGEGRADTRRQQPVEALRNKEDDERLFEATLQHLTGERLLTLGGEKGHARTADLAHEALIAGWPTLQGWLKERRDAELVRRRLEAKAAEWERLGRGAGGLLDEVELLEAQRWLTSLDAADLGDSEALSAFVQASQEAVAQVEREKEAARQRELALERRARQRLWGIIVVLGLLVLVGLGWLARQEWLRQSARLDGKLCPVPGLRAEMECYEVTNRRYALCVQVGQCSPPPQFDTEVMRQSALPVTRVDALQAAAFCGWIGRRLPTWAEWLHAATQGGRTTWPWGEEEPTREHANLLYEPDSPVQMALSQLQPVGGRASGATPGGIHDLIGNVWEWTATPWEKPGREGMSWGNGDPATAPSRLIMEGGGYMTSITGLGTVTQPIDAEVSFRRDGLGFRCVKGEMLQENRP